MGNVRSSNFVMSVEVRVSWPLLMWTSLLKNLSIVSLQFYGKAILYVVI